MNRLFAHVLGDSCCAPLPLLTRQPGLWHPQLPPASLQSPRPASTSHCRQSIQSHKQDTATQDDGEAAVFYRWPTVKHFRLLSRSKLYQVALMSLLLPPATISYQHGSLAGSSLLAAYIAAGGTLTVLLSLSHLFTRIVGEMAYLPASNRVRVSTLTFLGARRDIEVDPQHVLPLGGRALVQRLEIVGQGGVFMYSVRYGRVLDEQLMARLLLGR